MGQSDRTSTFILSMWTGAVGLAAVACATPALGQTAASPLPGSPAAPEQASPDGWINLPVPILLGNAEIGQPVIRIGKTGQLLSFDGREIIEILRPIVIPSIIAALQSYVTADGRLPIGRLADAGLQSEYNPRELNLRLLVPYALRTPGTVSIAARHPPLENVQLVRPAKTSAYVNLFFADDYLSQGGSGDDRGRQPFVIDFDGAVKLLGVSLEGTAVYREQSAGPWERGDVRLIKDFPEDRNRFTFGDLNYGTSGFQSFEQAGGISFSRNFDLQPYRISSSTAERTFTLTRPSDVEVIVNGRRVRTITLQPGRYNLRDLPLASGTNDVALRITDEVGRTETIAFPFVFDTNLLVAGDHEFSYALGVLTRDTASSKKYDANEPVFSAFHAYGVTDYLTLGANLQAAQRQRVVGAEARLGTVLGVFRGDVAVSQSSYVPTDLAARLQYRFTEPTTPDSLNRNLLASMTYRGVSFAPLGTTAPSNPTAFDIGMVYGQKLPYDWSGSLGFSVQLNRSGTPESKAFDLNLSRRFADSLHLDILGRRESQAEEPTEMSLLVTLSWTPFHSRQRVSVQKNTADRSTQVDWSYSPPTVVDAVQANLNAERLPEQGTERVRGDVSYVHYRYEAQLRYNQTFGENSSAAHRNVGLRLGTALVYADGNVAVSRPISDSFAMIVPHPSLKDHEVQVNSAADRPQAKTDALGPAVLPRMPAYYVQRITMNVPDVPPGYDLGNQIVNVKPTYRSGSVVTIGTGATASIEGILVDGAGKPIDLQIGNVVSLDEPGRELKGFFTDAAGRFQLIGLVPGRYELKLAAVPNKSARFEVPKDASGTLELGILVLPLEGIR